MISTELERRVFGGASGIGRTLLLENYPQEVIGVVSNVRQRAFTDDDTLLITENGDKDTVYRGLISSGAISPLAPIGSVPNVAGAIQVGSTVYE